MEKRRANTSGGRLVRRTQNSGTLLRRNTSDVWVVATTFSKRCPILPHCQERDSQLETACVARHRNSVTLNTHVLHLKQYNHPGWFRVSNLPDTADYLRTARHIQQTMPNAGSGHQTDIGDALAAFLCSPCNNNTVTNYPTTRQITKHHHCKADIGKRKRIFVNYGYTYFKLKFFGILIIEFFFSSCVLSGYGTLKII